MGANFVVMGASPDAAFDGITHAAVSTTGGTVVSAVAGKRIYVFGMHLTAAAAVAVTVQDVAAGSTVNQTGAMTLASGTPFVLPWQNYPWYTCAAGDALVFSQSTAVQVSGAIMYMQG